MAIFNNPHPLLDNEKGNFLDQEFNCELLESKIQDGLYSFQMLSDANIRKRIRIQEAIKVIHESK